MPGFPSLYISTQKQSLTVCGLHFITSDSLLGEARNSQARSRKHPASRGSPIVRKAKFSKTKSLYINLLATFPLRKLSLERMRSVNCLDYVSGGWLPKTLVLASRDAAC